MTYIASCHWFKSSSHEEYRIPKISVLKFSILPNPENSSTEIQDSRSISGISTENTKEIFSNKNAKKIEKKNLKNFSIHKFGIISNNTRY